MSYFSQFTNRQATPNRVISFSSSGNWVAPTAGWVTIAVVGAGGGGGAAVSTGGRATGGGAGGFAVKTFYTPAGATYVVTIGAGGTGGTATLGGASGGITTVNGTLCSLTCNSGGGGNAISDANAVLTGGVGGNATGGDINTTGGAGGDINATGVNNSIATGGGAVSINGVAYKGGNIAAGTTASGGAGVGGAGGAVNLASFASAGGGTGGPPVTMTAVNAMSNTQGLYNVGGPGTPTTVSVAPFLSFSAPGGLGLTNVGTEQLGAMYSSHSAGVGGGGGGATHGALTICRTGGNSAGFGGGGGVSNNLGNANSLQGGTSAMGGGGGAACGVGATLTYGGPGGQGGVFIGFYGNNT